MGWIVSVAPSLYPNHPSFTSLSASSFSALRTVVRPLQPEIATYLGFAMHLSVTATRDRSQRRTRVDSAILLERKKQLNQDLSLTVDSPGQSRDLAYNAFQSHS